jgi:hypothetical protein
MTDDTDKEPGELSKKELLIRIRNRSRLMIEGDDQNRQDAKDDIRFVSIPGEQWDQKVKTARGSRPCYEFDKLSIKSQRVINEMRANRPAGKVRAAEDGDKKTADVREGLCRNIANVSDLDTICDYAGVYQVEGGMGAWRVVTEYVKGSRRKQRIRAKPIPNPFCLYWDPSSTDPLKRDAQDWCLIDTMSKSAFNAKYGKKVKKISFDASECEEDPDWDNQENIRVCEYWYKETKQKEVWVLADGREIDSTAKGAESIDPSLIQSKESVDYDCIMMCIASGDAILEGPVKQAGSQHRFIVVHGAWKIVDGKPKWWGLVRKAKDAQRRYNVTQTAITETIASAPNTQYWATAKQAAGNTDSWDRALTENLPYLLYNTDPQAGGPPQRMPGPQVPAALMAESQIADQELKDVTGVYDAALGERSNEKSGVAISRREQQTQLVNFNFPDNMAKGVQRTWEIFNDLIPEIIDTEQMVRVLGVDGAEDYIKVNTVGIDPQTGQPIMVNDLTTGEYDITVTVGPSFATQRQEASETYTQLIQAFPPLMQVAPDLIMKAMDSPYSEEIAERMRMLLPPQIQETLNKDKKLPPEVMQAMQQVKQMQDMVTQQGQMVQAAAAEAEKGKVEAQKMISDLNVKRAQFDADVAKALANITMQEANFALKQAQAAAGESQDAVAQAQESLSSEVQASVMELQQKSAELAQQMIQAFAQIQAGSQPQVIMQPQALRPRIKQIQRGPNGTLIPQYEDAPTDSSNAPMPAMNGSMTQQ